VAAALAFTASAKLAFLENFDKSKSRFNPADPSSQYTFFNLSGAQPANDGVVTQCDKFRGNHLQPLYPHSVQDWGSPWSARAREELDVAEDWRIFRPIERSSLNSAPPQALGTAKKHVGPKYVTDVQDVLRLASCGPISIDPRDSIVADFYATNTARA
jgi:hypothetical protein